LKYVIGKRAEYLTKCYQQVSYLTHIRGENMMFKTFASADLACQLAESKCVPGLLNYSEIVLWDLLRSIWADFSKNGARPFAMIRA
jgi:hypothetical protein